MNSLLDILGASIMGGFLMLIAISASDTGAQEVYNYNADAIVQNNLAQMSRILEYDMKKIGFGLEEADSAILTGTASNVKFLAQLNMRPDARMEIQGVNYLDNIPDTIEYRIELDENIDFGDTIVAMYRLTRKVSLPPSAVDSSVIGRLSDNDVFRYLDQAGDPAPSLQGATTVQIQMKTINPRVILSPELVTQWVGSTNDLMFRKRELARILRPSFFRQNRLTSKNLLR